MGALEHMGITLKDDQHIVKPWFMNLCNPLNSFQNGGARKFKTSTGIQFGWQAIVDMYKRECQRHENGVARMIPRLREIHIIRDSWTKLNVTPAKITQVSFERIYTVFTSKE